MRLLMGVVLALCVACGDPRTAFVGNYKGNGTQTFSFSSGPDETRTLDAEFVIAAPPKSNRLQFGVSCMFTAEPLDGETIQIDAVTCATQRGAAVSGAMADFTPEFDRGVGRLANNTLSITQTGVEIGSNYSDGTPTRRFPFLLKLTMRR